MKDTSFDRMIDEYLVYCHSRQLRQKTLNSYEQALRLFERWCAVEMNITAIDSVTEAIVRHYIASIQERGKYSFFSSSQYEAIFCPERRRDFRKPVSATAINNYIRSLRVFFN